MGIKSRFMLADNPMRPDTRADGGHGWFIIHHLDPIAHIEANPDEPLAGYEHWRRMEYITYDGVIETWYLTITHFFTTEFDSEVHIPQVTHLFDRAERWFKAYLKKLDDDIKRKIKDRGESNTGS